MRRRQWIVRIFIVSSILALANFYVGVSYLSLSSWAQEHMAIYVLLLVVFFGLQMLAPILQIRYRTRQEGTAIRKVHWLAYASIGLFSSWFAFTVMFNLMAWAAEIGLHQSFSVNADNGVVAAITFFTVVTVLLGLSQAARGPKVVRVDVPVDDLPPSLDGFQIAQISDLHVGPFLGRRYVENVVQKVNALTPDVIAMTGDFADGSVEKLRNDIAPLADLKAKLGKYFITGNHEYYSGALHWIEEHRRLGSHVLINEHHVLEAGQIVMAGVTDVTAHYFLPEHLSSPQKAIAGAPAGAFKILLAHQPSSFTAAEAAGFDLQLSGHTHGGQFFPWTFVVRFFHRFFTGLGRHNKMWVYVNRGTGYWGPPLRTGSPAEITLLTLRRHPR